MRVAVLDHGAVTQGWWLGETPLILGYRKPSDHVTDGAFVGAIAGRVANRIGGARYAHGGRTVMLEPNEGRNLLHGGRHGIWSRTWQVRQATRAAVHLALHSPAGEGGFPGSVDFDLYIRLAAPCLTYDIHARTDRPIPISIAQHNYYCLGDPDGILAHRLRVAARDTLALGADRVPTGARVPVDGGPFDFRTPRPVAQADAGIDHYFVFDPARDMAGPVVELAAPSGLTLRVRSDQPGAQIYTGHGLGDPFRPFAGICIEPSGFPDAVNKPAFPSVMVTPDRPYRQVLSLEICGHPR